MPPLLAAQASNASTAGQTVGRLVRESGWGAARPPAVLTLAVQNRRGARCASGLGWAPQPTFVWAGAGEGAPSRRRHQPLTHHKLPGVLALAVGQRLKHLIALGAPVLHCGGVLQCLQICLKGGKSYKAGSRLSNSLVGPEQRLGGEALLSLVLAIGK